MQRSIHSVQQGRMCVVVLCLRACCGEVEFERLGELAGLVAAATSSGGNVHVHFTETTTVPHSVISSDDTLDRLRRSYMHFRLKLRV
jgi:hypothetical protein